MQSSRLPPFAAAAPSAPVARLKSATDYGAFARELDSRIAGSRDRQRASPADEGLSVGLTDGRDGRPERLASDRAEPHDDIEPTPVDVPPEPSADTPDIAPSDDETAGAPDDPRASGDPFGSSPGVAASFNPTLSTLLAGAALSPDNAGSADVSPAPPAANDSARTTPVSAIPATQPVTAAEASSLFAAPPIEAASSDATDRGAPSATTQAVAADVVSTAPGRTPIRREERRSAAEPARADGPTGSASTRSDLLVFPLGPLRASVVEESRTDGAVDGTSASRDEPTVTPNPATQLARALVDLAGGNTGTFEPVAPTEVGTTSEAPAPSSNVVAVGDTSVAVPTLTPTPVAQGNGATSGVAAMTPAPTTDADAPLQDVVKFVAGSVGSRNAHVRMQLDPPDLGAMRIDIRTRQQVLTVRIEVETADALARIQGGVAQLKQSLEQHGLVVERFDVQLRPTHSASPQSDGGDVRDDRFSDPHSSFERDRTENESSRGAGPSSAGLGGDGDDRIEDTATVASEGEVRRSILTAASVDLWA